MLTYYDVVAKTDAVGVLTYQASYEAFGTRPAEYGATADPQRANTKEEDPTGLLNEGQRYRDLETGVFLTRDPAGFVDGPNLYAYVRQNPWSRFDPEGLSEAQMYADMYLSAEDASSWRQAELAGSRRATPLIVGGAVAYASGGLALPYLTGLGASSGYALLGSGMIAGVSGDVAAQATETLTEGRTKWDSGRTALSGAAGGALSYGGGQVANAISGLRQGANAGSLAAEANAANRANAATMSSPEATAAQTAAISASESGTVSQANVALPQPPSNPITATSGSMQTVDPKLLTSGQQAALNKVRVQGQRELLNQNITRNTPIQVHENGVIYDGHHGARAAVEAGKNVNVQVVPGAGTSRTNLPPHELPTY